MSVLDLLMLDPAKLRHLATRRGWVKKDLADAAGISIGPIVAIFKRRPIGPRTAKKIADALGVKIIDLITEEPKT